MISAEAFVADYRSGMQKCLEAVPPAQIAAATYKILEAYRQDKVVAVIGNGGSAATASHLACDLGKTILGRNPTPATRRFRVLALTDNTALLTAWANDVHYEAVFVEQLQAWLQPDDLLIAISASGNSPNICAAIDAARHLGVYTIGFLGFDGGRAADLVDLPLTVPSRDYGYVEDIHVVLSHMITAYLRDMLTVESMLRANNGSSARAKPPKALILAAGEGTRLLPLTLECPKPMLPIDGKPLLEHIVCWLRDHNIADMAINLHHRPQTIVDYMGDGARWGARLVHSYEEPLLGTAGAVRKLQPFLKDGPFVVVYGDILTDLDLTELLAFHRKAVERDPSTGITMSLYRVPNPTEVGLVGMDRTGRITRFVEKPRPEEVFTDLASAGILVMEPSVISRIPPDTFYDFGKHLFPQLLASGVSMYGWVIPKGAYLLDIGTHEKYAQAQWEWPGRHSVAVPAPTYTSMRA